MEPIPGSSGGDGGYTAKMTLLHSTISADGEPFDPPVREIYLRGDRVVLGRSLQSDVIINSLQISRRHCIFEFKNNSQWWIQDMSTNGIGINGHGPGSLLKRSSREIANNDQIHLIPNILSYKFEYSYSNGPSSSSSPHPAALPVEDEIPLPAPSPVVLADNPNVSDVDSLFSLDDGEDLDFHTCLDDDENGLVVLDTPEQRRGTSKRPYSKRSHEVLKPRNNRSSKNVSPSKNGSNTKRHKTDGPPCVTIGDADEEEEGEELLDIDEDHPVITSPVQNPTNELMCGQTSKSQSSSPSKAPASVSVSPKEENVQDPTGVLQQLIYFRDKCKQLTSENSLLVLQSTMEKDDMNKEMNELKAQMQEKSFDILKDLAEVLDNELNCCVCNEIYIQPTVIDCGHTFCHYCITEWKKKKNDCPVCRKVIFNTIKHVELGNFLLRVHSLLPKEAQEKREGLLADRAEEVSVVEAVKTAEEAERANVRGRTGEAAGAAAGDRNFIRDLYLNQLEQFRLRDRDLNLMGFDWTRPNQVLGVAPPPGGLRAARRSPRARRGFAGARAAAPVAGTSNLDASINAVAAGAAVEATHRRQPRGRAGFQLVLPPRNQVGMGLPAAAGTPDLITLDDSQDQGAPAPPQADVQFDLLRGGRSRSRQRNVAGSLWEMIVGGAE